MGITISTPDALRQSVEAASGGRNTVLYDAKGYPSIMVVIPKFNLADIDASLGSGIHPAFVVNGATKSEIFIGKFQAIVHDGNALSLPAQNPATSLSFDQVLTCCTSKGPGWHLMTNAEWAAIALWCWKNGFQPRGNTNWGASSDAAYETGRRIDGGDPGTAIGTARTLTGSGPASWYHDNTHAGIADLAGNVWEWVGGLRLSAGEIQVLRDNDAADNTKDQTAGSALWRAISKTDGALVAPSAPGTLKYDNTSAGSSGVVGSPQLDDVIDHSNAPNGGDDGYTSAAFESLTADNGITPPSILRALGLFPVASSGLGGDVIQYRNYGERLPIRGGSWDHGAIAGIFALDLNNPRSLSDPALSFRPAYIL